MSQFIEMFGGIDKTSCTKQLKDYATFRGGFAFKSEQFKQNDVPIIRISNISGNTVEVDYNICYELDFWNKNPLYRVEKNDILIAMSGATTGKSGIYRSNRPALLNQRVASVRPKPNIALTSFIFMALQLDGMYKIIQDTAQGGAQPNISGKQIESLPMPSSTYEGQIYFDTIYNQADKSGFDGLKSQFIEMTGDPRTNPKGWPVKTLSELATYSIGLTYKPENISEDGTIVLRSGNIQNSKIDLGDIVRVNCPIKESIYVQKNDILMCSRNGSAALVGKVAMIKDIPEPMTYGAFMTVIRSEYSDYLYLYFQSNDFREQVSTGKSSTMNQITQNMLDKISLPLPDDETRNKLSVILHQSDKSGSVWQYRIAC